MPDSDIILYQTDDGLPAIEVHMERGEVWLTQEQIGVLFQREKSVISRHIRNIYDEAELDPAATVAKYASVAANGKTYEYQYYNLDVIISVGYRVKSHRGTQFRIWATERLKEYLVKGFVMDDARLSGEANNYFDELLQRVRKIRTSERNFYEKVLDIFATSIDYNRKTDYAQQFFATVQNKFHFAITGHTAAELVAGRADGSKPHMGLTSWKGAVITSADAVIAKNYLEEIEIKRLELLVEQFLSFAELRSVEKAPMYMADWKRKLDEFLILNDKAILENAGNVSRQDGEAKAKAELAKYNRALLESGRT